MPMSSSTKKGGRGASSFASAQPSNLHAFFRRVTPQTSGGAPINPINNISDSKTSSASTTSPLSDDLLNKVSTSDDLKENSSHCLDMCEESPVEVVTFAAAAKVPEAQLPNQISSPNNKDLSKSAFSTTNDLSIHKFDIEISVDPQIILDSSESKVGLVTPIDLTTTPTIEEKSKATIPPLFPKISSKRRSDSQPQPISGRKNTEVSLKY